MSESSQIAARKQSLRNHLRQLRSTHSDRESASTRICERLQGLEQFRRARTILFYVSARDEVATHTALKSILEQSVQTVVPFCDGERLKLVLLKHFDELAAGAFGILEPLDELRNSPERVVSPASVDVVLIPGLGFDSRGGRIGYGKGYYDRLLDELRSDCLKIGLAFDCQIVPEIPMEEHDQLLDLIVTETQVINCGRESSGQAP